MKISILIPAALALVMAAGLASAPADAAAQHGRAVVSHHQVQHAHWSRSSNEDYRQWRQFGGTRAGW